MEKGFVQADISTIIEKLAKDVKFLQPIYEAITNSHHKIKDNNQQAIRKYKYCQLNLPNLLV